MQHFGICLPSHFVSECIQQLVRSPSAMDSSGMLVAQSTIPPIAWKRVFGWRAANIQAAKDSAADHMYRHNLRRAIFRAWEQFVGPPPLVDDSSSDYHQDNDDDEDDGSTDTDDSHDDDYMERFMDKFCTKTV